MNNLRFREYGLFDAKHYESQVGQVSDPMNHFLSGGWRIYDPHPLFSCSYYLLQNPDVAEAEFNPLIHWIDFGKHEKRRFHPLFDTSYYCSQLPDEFDLDPLLHYLETGWAELDPHPLFSTNYYLTHNPDVVDQNINPLLHYLETGGYELRRHHPLFDPVKYQSITKTHDIPLLHFLNNGGLVDTTPLFNINWYLSQSHEARTSNQPPVIHWLTQGSQLGLTPQSHPFTELCSDLFLQDPTAAVILLSNVIPGTNHLQEKRVTLSFRINEDEPSETEFQDVHLIGGLPGLITKDAQLVGVSTPAAPRTIRHRNSCTIIRENKGFAVGEKELPSVADALTVKAGFDDSSTNWWLQSMPLLLEATSNRSGIPILVPHDYLEEYEKKMSQFLLSSNELIFLSSGTIKHIHNCELVTESSANRTRFVLSSNQSQHISVLLIDPRDEVPKGQLELLSQHATDFKLTIVDSRWPPEMVCNYINTATTIFAFHAAPMAAFLSPQDTSLYIINEDLFQVPTTSFTADDIIDSIQQKLQFSQYGLSISQLQQLITDVM